MDEKSPKNKKIFIRKKKAKKSNLPAEPLSKRQELNNHIVCMRNTVAQAKVQIINRVNHQILKYKQRKGNDKDKEKAQRKADRLVEEIHALKKVKKDIVSLYALQDTHKLEQVLSNANATLEEKALSRLSHHPLLQKDVGKYRETNPNWDMQIPVLLRMTTEKRKSKSKDKLDETRTLTNSNSYKRKTENNGKGIHASLVKVNQDDEYTSESEKQSSDKGVSEPNKFMNAKVKREVKGKVTIAKLVTNTEKSVNSVQPKVRTVDKAEGTVRVKLLKDLKDLETDDDKSLISKKETVSTAFGVTPATKSKIPKSAFFVGGVDAPEIEDDSRQIHSIQRSSQRNQNQNFQSKPVYKKGKLISKPPRPQNFSQQRRSAPLQEGRADNPFSGNTEPLGTKRSRFEPDNKRASSQPLPIQPETSEKLHPSWEAKKKQQISLTAFKGKKITFDNDDE